MEILYKLPVHVVHLSVINNRKTVSSSDINTLECIKVHFVALENRIVFLLWIISVIYLSCLPCFFVCSLQPCGHLLLRRANLLALLCVMFSCVFVSSHMVS